MGKVKKTRKIAAVKRVLNPKTLQPYVRGNIDGWLLLFLWLAHNKSPHGLRQHNRKQNKEEDPKQPKHVYVMAVVCIFNGGHVDIHPSPQSFHREKVSSALYFRYNTQLGPPYQVLVDTNFINFSIRNKVCSGCASVLHTYVCFARHQHIYTHLHTLKHIPEYTD